MRSSWLFGSEYVENVEYDIASGGGGLLTLVTLAAALELSDARILSEASTERRQVVIADALVWIDRSNEQGERCDEVGRILVDLGAVSHTEARAFVGADTILYFEDKPDRKVLSHLLDRCGKRDLITNARLERLGGFGDAKKLPGALDVINRLRRPRIAMAAILDADYTETMPSGSSENTGGVLMLRLPCKELENLLLLSTGTLTRAVTEAADRRSQYTRSDVTTPSPEEIESKIDDITGLVEIKDTLKPHWICQWAQKNAINLNDEGQLKRAQDEFEKLWGNPEWRRRCCPGKEEVHRVPREGHRCRASTLRPGCC